MIRQLATLSLLIPLILLAVACGKGGGGGSGDDRTSDQDNGGSADEFDPQGRFVVEWNGAFDVDLQVDGPTNVSCEATETSRGRAGLNQEIIDCVNVNGDAESGIYRATVVNRSGSTVAVTLRVPETDTETFALTRDYTGGRVRNIAVARTNDVYLQLNWSLNEDHDIRLFNNDTGAYTGEFPIAGRSAIPGCVGTFDRGDVFGPHQESISCTNIARDLFQFEFHRDPIIFSTQNYTAQVRTSAGGQGYTISDTLGVGGASADAFFLMVPGPVR